MNDEVEHPSHYDFGPLEAREIIEIAVDGFTDPSTIYHVASALKYLLRASRKGGSADIAKARKHIGWADDAAQAWVRSRMPPGWDGCSDMSIAGLPENMQFRQGDIDKVCDIRDAGEFTQPPNCSPGVSELRVHESTKSNDLGNVETVDNAHPMHAEALRMADEEPCNRPRAVVAPPPW